MTEQPLDTALNNFMRVTAKSTVAVIVPLYGYWNDIKDNPVNGEVLSAVMRRVYSDTHHLIYIFVANPETVEHKSNSPKSIANILIGKAQGGNVLNVSVSRNASYADYVTEGLGSAIEETKAQFFIVINPWILMQDGAIDTIIDRANYGDSAKVISGFDMRPLIEPEGFDAYKTTFPKEERDISLNFLCMPRYVAEMLQIDTTFRTHKFLERDIWQRMFSKGFEVITSQRIPIFPFDFPWQSYETKEEFDADLAYFTEKWRFNPGYKYED